MSGSDERRGQAKDSLHVHNENISVTRMPFGLKGAPATFQRLKDILLDGTHLYAAAYMDNLVVFSGSWEEHLQHVDEILQRIEQANLTLRAENVISVQPAAYFLDMK